RLLQLVLQAALVQARAVQRVVQVLQVAHGLPARLVQAQLGLARAALLVGEVLLGVADPARGLGGGTRGLLVGAREGLPRVPRALGSLLGGTPGLLVRAGQVLLGVHDAAVGVGDRFRAGAPGARELLLRVCDGASVLYRLPPLGRRVARGAGAGALLALGPVQLGHGPDGAADAREAGHQR